MLWSTSSCVSQAQSYSWEIYKIQHNTIIWNVGSPRSHPLSRKDTAELIDSTAINSLRKTDLHTLLMTLVWCMQRLNWWKQAKVTSTINRWWNLRTRYEIFWFLYYWGIHSVQVARFASWERLARGYKAPTLCVTKGWETGPSETRQQPSIPSPLAWRAKTVQG